MVRYISLNKRIPKIDDVVFVGSADSSIGTVVDIQSSNSKDDTFYVRMHSSKRIQPLNVLDRFDKSWGVISDSYKWTLVKTGMLEVLPAEAARLRKRGLT